MSANRLQHELSHDEVNQIMVSQALVTVSQRKNTIEEFGSQHLNMQIEAPLAPMNSRILANSYVSQLELDSVTREIDLEMAVNLGCFDKDKVCKTWLNLNVNYDFRPTNFTHLILQRLALAPKKKRIHKYVQKQLAKTRSHLQTQTARIQLQEQQGQRN